MDTTNWFPGTLGTHYAGEALPRVVARWESRGRKHFVELYKDQYGYGYRAVGAGGFLGALADDQTAVATIERRVNDFQPDANKTPMRRVV